MTKKMTKKEYYEKIYRLCYIIRYGNIPRIKNESVAEHTFLINAMLLQLNEEYEFDLGKALVFATAHDILEADTSDICHTLKRDNKELYEAIKKAEKSFASRYPPTVKYGIEEYDKGDTVESKVVHLADAMQCLQTANNELKTGGNEYFLEVQDNSLSRIKIIKDSLIGVKK